MSEINLDTYAENTWCKGCGNFGILTAANEAIKRLIAEGYPQEKITIASGIGCSSKIVDYINVNSFYSIHGRVPPTVTGIKLANKDLAVIGFTGDGDGYGEGLAHIIMSAKRNIDVTMVVHNNRVYGLTTGQFTPTSPMGFPGKSTPRGSVEHPMNPLDLMLAAGATFVARGFSVKTEHLADLIVQGVKHKGFAFIDVLQPCFTFFNTFKFYNSKVYELEGHDPADLEAARTRAREWNYDMEAEKIPIGLFFKTDLPSYDEQVLRGLVLSEERKRPDIQAFIR